MTNQRAEGYLMAYVILIVVAIGTLMIFVAVPHKPKPPSPYHYLCVHGVQYIVFSEGGASVAIDRLGNVRKCGAGG